MPVPNQLASAFYYPVWNGALAVQSADQHGGRNKTKTFFAYLEVGDQCKHDNSMRGYCLRNNVTARRTQDTQVRPANNGNFAYYQARGQVACRRVARFMHDRWTANTVNSQVFDSAGSETLTVQGEVQSDGWHYEMTMYYRGNDVHVAFHCYP